MKIDLIIPTYKPDKRLIESIDRIAGQSVAINRIIIMNTEQKYFDRMDMTPELARRWKNFDVKHISKKEFDHGKTRNQGINRSDADYFLLMTQDAVPVDDYLVENLLNAFDEDPRIAVSYARQVAGENASEIEKFTRTFNYPEESAVHSEADIDSLGIRAFFCSNVCAMYRRDIFDELGGFLNHTIFNEDMLYAAKAIYAGYKIAYAADACVIHSHNYSGAEQYKRNFDIGVSHAKHPEIFANLNTKGEGIKLVNMTANHLRSVGHSAEILHLYYTSACKYLGYRKGVRYARLSKKTIMRKTMNPGYWVADELLRDRGLIDARQGYGRSEYEMEMMAKPPVASPYRANSGQESEKEETLTAEKTKENVASAEDVVLTEIIEEENQILEEIEETLVIEETDSTAE